MTNNITQESETPIFLLPFKWIYLGLSAALYYTFTTIFFIIKYALSGIKFILIDGPKNIYLNVSGGVDYTYRKTKSTIKDVAEGTAKKAETANSFYRNLSFVKANKEKLEETRRKLMEELNSEDAKRVDKPTVFKYTAKDKDEKMVTGTFTGFSKLDVNAYLLNEGYTVYNIESSKWITFAYGQSSIITKKLSNKNLIFWLTQLKTYIKSGIPLTDSVRILSNQMGKDKNQKRIFESIVYELTMGETFSRALEKQGSIFPQLLINMLKAAEATGDLVETLDDMATYYTEIETTRKQIVSAMTYPSLIMIFAVGVITFIMLYVIPQFMEVYNSVGAQINGLTLAIINISNFVQLNLTNIFLVILVIIIVMTYAYKKVKAFRTLMQTFLMHMPIIGKIMIYKEITIFTKTFASLLRNNVFIKDSIDILSKVTNNEIYKSIMYNTIANITKGDKISLAFKDNWAIPDVAYYMIVTGESTGELATMMSRVAEYFQEQNRNSVNSLKAFIEPIMISGLALVVGIIILAIIVPMFDLYGNIQDI